MPARIKAGDTVMVIAGKDRGRQGKVRSVNAETNRVIVEGINIQKKHQKATGLGQPSGIIEREASLHVSNVMPITKDGRPTRVAVKMGDDGKRVRVAKRSGEVLA